MITSKHRLLYYPSVLDKRADDAVSTLFGQLRQVHGIAADIVPLRVVPSIFGNTILVPDAAQEKEIYERDFLPRWRTLNARTGKKIGKVLRSRSNRYCLAGTLALASDEGVEWYSTYGDRFSAHDEDYRVGFLKVLLARGPALLDELCMAA